MFEMIHDGCDMLVTCQIVGDLGEVNAVVITVTYFHGIGDSTVKR